MYLYIHPCLSDKFNIFSSSSANFMPMAAPGPMIMGEDQGDFTSSSSSSQSNSSSATSNGSSSLDFADEASSFSSSGPPFEFSELMANLPIKRGISKFYEGKSQSFTSLSSVKTLEDLAKKEKPYAKRLKVCKSNGGGMQTQKSYLKIPKKVSRNSNLSVQSRPSAGFMSCSRLPAMPVQLQMKSN